jgi:uncharacterized protein YndB with AHSA1/START domain
MHAVWDQSRQSQRMMIPDEDAAVRVEADIAMPPNLVWEYLAQPEFRKILLGSDRQEVVNRSQGRLAPGSGYQCFHGKRVVLQTILEWRPFEQIVTEDLVTSGITVLMSFRLDPSETGTHLVETFGKARGQFVKRTFLNMFLGMETKTKQQALDSFKQQIEADLAQRLSAPLSPSKPSPEAIEAAAAQSLAVSAPD